jgi:hypothetical protein
VGETEHGCGPRVDPRGRGEGIRLVEYLRTSFAWGGFPGFEFYPPAPPELDELRAELLPI